MTQADDENELEFLRSKNRDLQHKLYELRYGNSEVATRGPAPFDDLKERRQVTLPWLGLGIIAIFCVSGLAWVKIPDPAPSGSRYNSPGTSIVIKPGALSPPVGDTPSVMPASRAIILSAIEGYTTTAANVGRASIPEGELLSNVIDPLAKTGLIASEAGKQVLTATLDGGKTLATDYFHQRWAAEFGDKAKAKDSSAPTVVCSPVFNAAPPPTSTVRAPVTPHRETHHAQPSICPTPKLREIKQ